MAIAVKDLPTATEVKFTENEVIFILSSKGRLSFSLSEFPRLEKATQAQRKKWRLRNEGRSIRWDEIDEDISIPLLLTGKCD